MTDSAPINALWVYLTQRPLLWLTLTILVHLLALKLHQRCGGFWATNPVLISVLILVLILLGTHTPYAVYFEGAQFVHFLLGPATVALAVPLYRQWQRLRRMWRALLLALLIGSTTGVLSALLLGHLLGLDAALLASLVPKSVTTPVAMGISEQLGGLPSLTAVLVILTGIIGATLASPLLRLAGVSDPSVRGFALGLSAHGIGTARALQHSDEKGAFAGLAMGLNAACTALLAPLVLYLFF